MPSPQPSPTGRGRKDHYPSCNPHSRFSPKNRVSSSAIPAPICAWCGYPHGQVAPDPTADGISARVLQVLVHRTVIPVDDRQHFKHAALHRQHRQRGSAAGLLAAKTGKPVCAFSSFSARFIGSTLLIPLYFQCPQRPAPRVCRSAPSCRAAPRSARYTFRFSLACPSAHR